MHHPQDEHLFFFETVKKQMLGKLGNDGPPHALKFRGAE